MTRPSNNDDGVYDKGKKPETEESTATPNLRESSSHSPSLVSRLQDSATVLSRAAINGQPESTILGATSSEKQQQLPGRASSSSAAREISQSRPRHGNISSGLVSATPNPHSEDRYNSFLFSQATAPQALLETNESMHGHGTSSPLLSNPILGRSAVEVQQSCDGVEAVQLLSDSVASDTVFSDQLDSVTAPVLSADEARALNTSIFGEDQPGGFSRSSQDWNGLLNFQPAFFATEDIDGIHQHLGVLDPIQAEQIWLDDWRDVLSSYNDEVWGDLGPLAEAARNELSDAKHGSQASRPTDMKALGRLRQILAHVRQSY